MRINIKYFAAMREQAGLSEEVVNTNAKTASELLLEVSKKYNFSLNRETLKVAINEEYSCFDTNLKEDDCIVFIPPVAGG